MFISKWWNVKKRVLYLNWLDNLCSNVILTIVSETEMHGATSWLSFLVGACRECEITVIFDKSRVSFVFGTVFGESCQKCFHLIISFVPILRGVLVTGRFYNRFISHFWIKGIVLLIKTNGFGVRKCDNLHSASKVRTWLPIHRIHTIWYIF